MTTTLPSPEVQAASCEALLRRLVDHYYQGCKAYAAAPQPDSPQRVFWRIRLGVLQGVVGDLADALGVAEPDWEALRDPADHA